MAFHLVTLSAQGSPITTPSNETQRLRRRLEALLSNDSVELEVGAI